MSDGFPSEQNNDGDLAGDGRPIGVFDSGIGGLSVVSHLLEQLPHENLLYFADQAHIPYGIRPVEEIVGFSIEIARFLIAEGAKVIVVACNTATAMAIDALRAEFPETPFVGMEPALKPAATATRSGKIGVLATPGTFASRRYGWLMDRFAHQIDVFEDPCIGLVSRIEAGELSSPETRQILETATAPMLSAGADTLVLGCTHYPFVLPLLESIVGSGVTIIDPAPAVARQTGHVLQQRQLFTPSRQSALLTCFTSGDVARGKELAARLLGYDCTMTHVDWVAGQLTNDTATPLHLT